MRGKLVVLTFGVLLALSGARAQSAPPQKPPVKPQQEKPKADSKVPAKETPEDEVWKISDAELELQRAVAEAGNDQAALVRNLEDYLRRFPEAQRRVAVYRALVEVSLQLRDNQRALDYTERIIAVQPEDSAMMLLAVDLLERLGDDRSLAKAVGYATRVLDLAQKSPAEKPPRVSAENWELEKKNLQMSVYVVRGRLEMTRRRYDEAVADLEAAYRILPNPAAAERLGEIAEVRKNYEQAIEQYLIAFCLPRDEEEGDRLAVRRKLGNVWRMVHGSEAGLGERILATYDSLVAESKRPQPPRNEGLMDPFAFVLRRLDGTELKLDEWRGKVVVLNFWATWCGPCRELEPLFEKSAERFRENDQVRFLAASTDEDEDRVKPYVEKEKVRVPVVFADGLDVLLRVQSIPTVMVLGRNAQVVYRSSGFSAHGFVEELAAAIERALAAPN